MEHAKPAFFTVSANAFWRCDSQRLIPSSTAGQPTNAKWRSPRDRRCSAAVRATPTSSLQTPHGTKPGAVWLGCNLLGPAGRVAGYDCPRHALTPGDGRPVAPGETLTLDVKIPAPPKGSHVLEFDLVSEAVAWFATVGSEPARVNVEVK